MMGRSWTNAGGATAALAGVAIIVACLWLTAAMVVDFYAAVAESPGAAAQRWRDAPYAMLFLMWAVMMAAMMAPSAAPFLAMFWRAHGRVELRAPPGRAAAMTAAAGGGYLATWCAFSAAAAALQSIATLNDGLALHDPALRAALFAAAGAYQLTPLKRACLRGCRPAPTFFILHFRPGALGALGMGARHGLYCAGCCWALMLLLFAGGVMDWRWIAGLAAFALAEKVLPAPRLTAGVAGAALLALAAWELAAG